MYCTYCILAKPTVLNVKSAVGWIREYFIENDYYARVRTFSRFLCRLRTTEQCCLHYLADLAAAACQRQAVRKKNASNYWMDDASRATLISLIAEQEGINKEGVKKL